jgi:hypothetical protein
MKLFVMAMVAIVLVGCGRKSPAPLSATTVAALRTYVPADLQFKPAPLADKDNGYLTFVKAAQALSPGTSSASLADLGEGPYSDIQKRKATQLLRDNRVALTEFKKAVAKKRWRGRVDQGSATAFPELAGGKTLAKLLSVSATLALSEGRSVDAARDLILARQAGERFVHSETSVIHYLVGVAIEAIAERAMEKAAWVLGMNRDGVRMMLASLPASKPDDGLAGSLRSEFENMFLFETAKIQSPKDAVLVIGVLQDQSQADAVKQALEDHPMPLDREATVREAARLYLEILKNASRTWDDQVDVQSQADSQGSVWPASFLTIKQPTEADIRSARNNLKAVSNPLGRLLVSAALPLVPPYLEFKRRFTLDVTRMSLANRLYALGHGGSAAPNLGALGLDVHDPISGGAYHYDPRRQVVWSVGQDKADDKGLDPFMRFDASTKDWVAPLNGHYAAR